jgi:hypothetical protein
MAESNGLRTGSTDFSDSALNQGCALVLVMTALDAPRAWWDEGAGSRFFKTASFGGYDETPEPNSHPTLPAFFCAQRTRLGARQVECTRVEITITLVTVVGLLIALTFWAVVAR